MTDAIGGGRFALGCDDRTETKRASILRELRSLVDMPEGFWAHADSLSAADLEWAHTLLAGFAAGPMPHGVAGP